jgi:uncharacterized protein YkwD
MNHKILERTLVLTMLVPAFSQSVLHAHAETGASLSMVNADTPVVDIAINDFDALNDLKQKLIEMHAKDGMFSLGQVNLAQSRIRADHLDANKVGTQNVKIQIDIVAKQGSDFAAIPASFTQPVVVNITDSAAPEISLKATAVGIKKGDDFNAWDYLNYAYDNSQVYPTVTEADDVDASRNGTYTVTFRAVDESGNHSETTMKVRVGNTDYVSTSKSIDLSTIQVDGDSIYSMLALINAVREQNGLADFQMADDAGLTAAAIRAQEAAGYCSHTRPDGTYFATVLDQCDVVPATYPAEILTYAGSSIQDKLNWWLNSPGHHAKLMSNASTIALGTYNGMWVGIIY